MGLQYGLMKLLFETRGGTKVSMKLVRRIMNARSGKLQIVCVLYAFMKSVF